MGITIILPAYREAKNLKILLPKIKKICAEVNKFEILVVDAMHPTDNTKKICEDNDATYLSRDNGNLYGDAIRTGIRTSNYKWTVIMDSDGSHDPTDILRLYEKAEEGYDIVIGSRYMEGGSTHNGLILRAMSSVVNSVYRTVFKINAKDVSNSFRIYNTKKLKSLHLSSNDFDVVEEILILFGVKYPSYKLTEIPIFFSQRVHGNSKRNLFSFSISYIQSIFRLLKLKNNAKKEQ